MNYVNLDLVVGAGIEVKAGEVRRERLVDDVIEAARKVVAGDNSRHEHPTIRALRLALVELDIAESR